MPEPFPSCFWEPSDAVSHVSSSSSSYSSTGTAQNLVTCLYQTKLAGLCRLISVTWWKSLMGHGLTISVDYPSSLCSCKVDLKPWLFWKKQGSKSFNIRGKKVAVFWDLSLAKYCSSPEPQGSFYVALVCDEEIVLFLGDLLKEAMKKTNAAPAAIEATLVSRKEHLFGKKFYTTKAQLGDAGRAHDIVIECQMASEKEPRLSVRVDRQVVLQVKHLTWKFRGNQTIMVDGVPVELFWDVHNWLFNPSDGHAVFMFLASLSANNPFSTEIGCPASRNLQGASAHSFKNMGKKHWFTESSCSSVLQWPNAHYCKDKGAFRNAVGFSLLLYAWKSE